MYLWSSKTCILHMQSCFNYIEAENICAGNLTLKLTQSCFPIWPNVLLKLLNLSKISHVYVLVNGKVIIVTKKEKKKKRNV